MKTWITAFLFVVLFALQPAYAQYNRISLDTLTNGIDADSPPGPLLPVDTPVIWTFQVTNSTGQSIYNIQVMNNMGMAVACPGTELLNGETMECTASGIVRFGQFRMIGMARANRADGSPVFASDPTHYFGVFGRNPAIDIEKFTNGEDADLAPGPVLTPGDAVQWTYEITNIGDITLASIVVQDDQGVAVLCQTNRLLPGNSMVCLGAGTAITGQYENVGMVSAVSLLGDFVHDSDVSHYLGEAVTGEDGCSHGFWKNHEEQWIDTGYEPDQLLVNVFAGVASFPDLSDDTLMEALHYKGGNGMVGAAKILLRQAVAALLNAAHPDVLFPMVRQDVVDQTGETIANAGEGKMLEMAEAFDDFNNLGCTLE